MDMTHVSGFLSDRLGVLGVYRYLLQGGDSGVRIKLIKVAMLSDAKAIRLWLVRDCASQSAHEETGRNGAMGSAADRDLLSRRMSRQA